MRGKPLVQWSLFLVVWTALLVPLIRVTHGTRPPSKPPAAVSTRTTTWVSVRFSNPPASFAVHQAGTSLWEEERPDGLEFERAVPLAFNEFGTELRLTAELPAGVTAIEVRLEPDARSARSRTVWTSGMTDEVVSFSWRRHD